ncbi:MAG: 2Fe-2S iron-sulfur cluster binding domain-containing protein [Burkholderiaceae bacterium]
MTTSTVTVLNNGVIFSASYDQCVLDSGLAEGVALPHQCRGASCGQCKAHIEEGTVNHGWSFGLAITDAEKDDGYCLMCQARPTSAQLVLRTVQPMGNEAQATVEVSGALVAVEQLTPRVRRLVFHVPDASRIFRPGSYAELQLPSISPDRVYSFANSESERDQLEFLVALHPEGRASGYLHSNVRVGDFLGLKGPFGACRLPVGSGPVLGMAGGTGLAPVLSIFESELASGATDQFTLLFAVRTDDDIFALDRLMALAGRYANFTYGLVVAEGQSRFCAHPMLISDYIRASYQSLVGWRAVVSGSPGFVAAATEACRDQGMHLDDISADSFVDVQATVVEAE